MRRLLFFLLLVSPLASAQFTLTSGTVKDPNGLAYSNGTITPTLVISGSPRFASSGLGYSPPTQPTGLDSKGSFAMQLADVNALIPTGGTWSFHVCSAAGTVQPGSPITAGPVCFDIAGIVVTGATMDISTQLNAAAKPLANLGSGLLPPTCSTTSAGSLFCPVVQSNNISDLSTSLRFNVPISAPGTANQATLTFGGTTNGIGSGPSTSQLGLYTSFGTGVHWYVAGVRQGYLGSGSAASSSGPLIQSASGPLILQGEVFANGTGISLQNNLSATTGTAQAIGSVFGSWAPSTGASGFTGLLINPLINQTGTATGRYTALGVYPQVTSALGTPNYLIAAGTATAQGAGAAGPGSASITTVFTVDPSGNIAVPVQTPTSCSNPAYGFANSPGDGLLSFGVGAGMLQCIGGIAKITFGGTTLRVTSDASIGWSSTTNATAAFDTSLSRGGPGIVDVNGVIGLTGKVKAAAYMSVGTTFTSNAGCSETALIGGATAGKFTIGVAGSCSTVITMGNTATAPNGWSCTVTDLTTGIPATNPHQTATSTTTTTIAMGTANISDVIQFGCIGY